MKAISVDDRLYAALAVVADRSGKPIQELLHEAIASWLADATEYTSIEQARAEAAEKGGVEFEAFFDEVLGKRA